MRLDYDTSEMYWQSMTVIEAQDMLLQYGVADYPHMKADDRKKSHKRASDMAYPKSLRPASAPLSTRDLMSKIASMINGK